MLVLMSTEQSTLDPHVIVERNWPYDGPYTQDRTTSATTAISELVRYLANATWYQAAVPNARTGYDVVRDLAVATHRLNQVIDQLQEELADGRIGADPTLYDDRRGGHSGAETASQMAGALSRARALNAELASALDAAASLGSHLGNDSL